LAQGENAFIVLKLGFGVSNYLIGGIEWTADASGFDVGKPFASGRQSLDAAPA
jgi:hypothetical protein